MDTSRLTERLRGIIGTRPRVSDGPPTEVAPDTVPSEAPAVVRAATPAAKAARRVEEARLVARAREALGGDWRECGGHRAFVVERRWAPEATYGRERVGDLAASLSEAMAAAPVLAAGAPAAAPLVFFDLETTGLSGGAGTYAFLVGCGRFEPDGAFVVRQYVMLRYADEAAMLRAVGEEIGAAGALVSFNGKSFDVPVLETRYLFHRQVWAGAGRPHIDVLHPARRFWREPDMASCALGVLETTVLGARRHGDVPGFEIPERYFGFVRSGDAEPLAGVLEHNRLDLLSLAGLAARLLTLVAGGSHLTRTGREALALGAVYERCGRRDEACEAFARATAFEANRPASDVRLDALRAPALAHRRARRFDEAAAAWRQIMQTRACPRPLIREATEALAIHHEHRSRDLDAARVFALRTLQSGGSDQTAIDAAQRRISRLERKMMRRESPWRPGPLVAEDE